jgi:hypothetical protein
VEFIDTIDPDTRYRHKPEKLKILHTRVCVGSNPTRPTEKNRSMYYFERFHLLYIKEIGVNWGILRYRINQTQCFNLFDQWFESKTIHDKNPQTEGFLYKSLLRQTP